MKAARLGDPFSGICRECESQPTVTGQIVTASTTTTYDEIGAARLGDTVQATCGHTGTIVSNVSIQVKIDDIPAAYLGSVVDGDIYGTIVGGSDNVNIII